jgi:hypothetical protein
MADDDFKKKLGVHYEKLSSAEHLRRTRAQLSRQIELLSKPPHEGRENWPHIVDRLQADITEIDEILRANGY